MTTKDAPLCAAFDQISDRKCRYYADHGGSHNFARLDHDSSLERELRCALDKVTKGLAEALDGWSHEWATKPHDGGPVVVPHRMLELRKLVQP